MSAESAESTEPAGSAGGTPLLSRLSLLLALAASLLATVWALQTAPTPNADRYDYLARAWHLTEGEGPRPLVHYPLRLARPGATVLPAENLTRPPLWPAIVSVPMRLGVDSSAAVLAAALCLFGIVAVIARATPGDFGGFAALACVGAFATWRGLLGGGPELALALLLIAVWTWTGSPQPSTRIPVLGSMLGLMPWLHPVGWVYLAIGLGSRLWRDPPRTLLAAGLLAILFALPWYLEVGTWDGQGSGPLQAQAELARAVHDGGGLGPYRTLEGVSSAAVIRADPVGFVRHVAHNLKELLRHLDGWLAWPMVLIGLWGVRHDPWLALRDVLLIGAGFLCVATVAFDPRLLLPLLPVAALWVGVGVKELSTAGLPDRVMGLLPLIVALPWILPLGLTPVPGRELEEIPAALRDPSRATVLAYGRAGTPGEACFTDSSVLAWRARRPGVAIPADPATLDRLASLPAFGPEPVLIASAGTTGWWFHDAAWAPWWAERAVENLEGTPDGRFAFVHAAPQFYIPDPLQLGPGDRPASLVPIAEPLAVRPGLELTREAHAGLLTLVEAAAAEGVHLRVTSAYRPYERQAELYASAQARHGADQRWVAPPGTSEHQLGTTVDFCDAAMQQVLEPGFADTAEGQWLTANANRFGWVRSYTEQNESASGYRPEAWHYRFGVLTPSNPEN